MTRRKIWKSNEPCCFCHLPIAERAMTDWLRGNNALPVMDGRCCDICNDLIVMPVRLLRIYAEQYPASRNLRSIKGGKD
jgi:hypothetical protein